ncbi:MAG: hypothetical protein R2800_01100 [Flavipsychrobacter sp.]
MTFDHNTFATELGSQNEITISKSWFQWANTSGSLNTTMEYMKGGDTYRTWYQETSNMKEDAGMLVSCKIDYERATGDDHIILLTGFAITQDGPKMIFAQASVQFHGSEDNNIVGAPVKSGDMAQGVYDSLSAILSDNFGEVDDSTAGRQTLPEIAKLNVAAMQAAVS